MRSHVVYTTALHNRYSTEIPSIRKLRQWESMYSAREQANWLTVPHALNATDLLSVHSSEYIAAACAGKTGYPKELTIWALWSCAAHLKAAEVALDERAIVCAPVSGFHHAGRGSGGGYCIFNGLAHTLKTLNKRIDRKALILDLDAHYGNGTVEILSYDTELASFVDHVPAPSATHFHIGFFDQLKRVTDRIKAGEYGMILYQAGMDAWVDDPFDAGYLTERQLVRRDRDVFDACVASNTPCVWNFAGGYAGKKTARLHAETKFQADAAVIDAMSKELNDGESGKAWITAAQG